MFQIFKWEVDPLWKSNFQGLSINIKITQFGQTFFQMFKTQGFNSQNGNPFGNDWNCWESFSHI
jgi:hypothetical protein